MTIQAAKTIIRAFNKAQKADRYLRASTWPDLDEAITVVTCDRQRKETAALLARSIET